jgi:hypothetical protein
MRKMQCPRQQQNRSARFPLSSVEAARAILDRINRLDRKAKSYATITVEGAQQDA